VDALIIGLDAQMNPSAARPGLAGRSLGKWLKLDRPRRLALFRSGLAEASLRLAELEKGPLPRDPKPGVNLRHAESFVSGQAPGVNVFGDWAATTGLAQAARRLTVALSDAGFGLSLGTVASGAPQDESRVPEALRRIPDDRRYPIDLWMLNVNEFPAIKDEMLRPVGRNTYAIGVWYWELTTFPDGLIAQMDRVDEIWVATTFVQSSFRSVTNRPVHVVPAVVPELHGSGRTRKDFGLADGEVVFLFSFDVHSMVARKNPGAVIEAFKMAFPSPDKDGTRLVIKALNLDRHPRVAAWIRDAVESVDGILMEDDLKADELVDLFLCADSYVSLHRSEGFGFGIAESMALGRPVIATAYSGNTDFATAANSCQVGYRLREITSEDHLYDEGASEVYRTGAVWAEPDVAQAARWMRVVARDPELRRRIGEAARATICERYSAAAVVEIARSRLIASARTSSDGL
jgi:glycosyltransferase involved in cell wall biosynthesis